MPRQIPDVDLSFCETHDLLKITPLRGEPDGEGGYNEPVPILLATAQLVIDGQIYKGGIMQTSENKASLTSATDRVTIGIQNVDKVIGLTINTLAASLVGAKAEFKKAFRVETTLQHELWTRSNVTSNPTTGAVARDSGDNTWNAGGFTEKGIRRVGYIEAKLTTNVNGASWIGLSTETETSDFVPSFANRDWLFYASLDRYLYVFYRGVLVHHTLVQWQPSDVIKIDLTDEGQVRFLRNNVELYAEYWSLPPRPIYGMAAVYNVTGSIQELNFFHDNEYDARMLLTGEISDIRINEDLADVTVVSDITTGQAFAANHTLNEFCPLVFKSVECGYVGPLTFCSKRYDTSDGCAGRDRQHRFAGIVDKGELEEIIIVNNGGFEEIIGPHIPYIYNNGNGYNSYVLPNTSIYY